MQARRNFRPAAGRASDRSRASHFWLVLPDNRSGDQRNATAIPLFKVQGSKHNRGMPFRAEYKPPRGFTDELSIKVPWTASEIEGNKTNTNQHLEHHTRFR